MALTGDLKDVVETFRSRTWPEGGPEMDREALNALLAIGFSGQLRFPRPYMDLRGKSHNGWINIMVERTDGPIAIEVDLDSPRDRSVQKLRVFKGKRLIVIRRGKSFRPTQIRGIDAVISVSAEPAKSITKPPKAANS